MEKKANVKAAAQEAHVIEVDQEYYEGIWGRGKMWYLIDLNRKKYDSAQKRKTEMFFNGLSWRRVEVELSSTPDETIFSVTNHWRCNEKNQ